MKCFVRPGGTVEAIYSDSLARLFINPAAVSVETARASDVEPVPGGGGWVATMRPEFGGAVLGPFALRQQALDAEVVYLNDQLTTNLKESRQ